MTILILPDFHSTIYHHSNDCSLLALFLNITLRFQLSFPVLPHLPTPLPTGTTSCSHAVIPIVEVHPFWHVPFKSQTHRLTVFLLPSWFLSVFLDKPAMFRNASGCKLQLLCCWQGSPTRLISNVFSNRSPDTHHLSTSPLSHPILLPNWSPPWFIATKGATLLPVIHWKQSHVEVHR